MASINLVSPPIEVQSWRKKGSIETLIGSKVTEFKSFANGKFISPYKSYDLKSAKPLTIAQVGSNPATIGPFNSLLFNSFYFDLNKTFNYNSNGNLISQQKANDVSKIYIWDYNSAYPIAECINADSVSVAYTSFETPSSGDWNFTGSTSTHPNAVTGLKGYNLAGGNITKSGLNSSTTYIITYWKRDSISSVTVNSGNGTPLVTRNGWVLYNHEITGTSSLTISGTAYIDELKVYPKGGLMTTYTYQPLIGMTSQCDVNNRITYYEYDNFNRLKLIRDQDKNIIKTFDYKYKEQQ
jgi:hypothetical protein